MYYPNVVYVFMVYIFKVVKAKGGIYVKSLHMSLFSSVWGKNQMCCAAMLYIIS